MVLNMQHETSHQVGHLIEVRTVHISRIRVGDTVFHNAQVKTVGQSDLKNDDFMGPTLFGDSYILGRRLVQCVVVGRLATGCPIRSF